MAVWFLQELKMNNFAFFHDLTNVIWRQYKIPRRLWRHHGVAWRGRTAWRQAPTRAVYCSFFGTKREKRANELSSGCFLATRGQSKELVTVATHRRAHREPWRTRTSSNTSSSGTRVSKRPLAVSSPLAAGYFRSVGRSNDVVKPGMTAPLRRSYHARRHQNHPASARNVYLNGSWGNCGHGGVDISQTDLKAFCPFAWRVGVLAAAR